MARQQKDTKSEERRAQHLRSAREAIMLAAARTVTHAGYQATTMRTIAKEAGYTASSLYTYFKSKEELFGALRDELSARFEAVLAEPLPGCLDFGARVSVLTHRLGRFAEDYQEAIALHVFGNVEFPDEDGAARIDRLCRFSGLTEAWFARNGAAEELNGHSPQDVATLYMGIFSGFMERSLMEGEGGFEPEAIERNNARCLAYFLAALTAPAGA